MTTTVSSAVDFYSLSHADEDHYHQAAEYRGATEERFGSMHRFNLPTGTYLCLTYLGLGQIDVCTTSTCWFLPTGTGPRTNSESLTIVS